MPRRSAYIGSVADHTGLPPAVMLSRRARSHGFLKRAASAGGKKTMQRRRRKGRAKISH